MHEVAPEITVEHGCKELDFIAPLHHILKYASQGGGYTGFHLLTRVPLGIAFEVLGERLTNDVCSSPNYSSLINRRFQLMTQIIRDTDA